ncbi:MAG: UDP-N-acetylmuramate--L-alanine ligase [Propionibacteriaceae bacterium]|jgi:UDP-N-acetylmuramate--alanine ligase|nr:UDP-N-acetylmuramate--L-alanine ligase [Propionibacteriaceae bacterium]
MLREPVPLLPLNELGAVHFIAIGGAGMSGVAQSYLDRGVAVSGSDRQDSEALRSLAAAGARVWVGHDAAHLDGVDTVVVSSAIRPDNPELAEAQRRGLRIWHRSAALAALMAGRRVIAVAGTHGKTTTSGMCADLLTALGRDPSYVIGAPLVTSGHSSHLGDGAEFVVEADESDGSFHQYPSQIAIVTSIEADHLDNWGTPAAYAAGFERFARGETVEIVVADGDEPGSAALAAHLRGEGRAVVTYGVGEGSDLRLSDLVTTIEGASAHLDISPGSVIGPQQSWSGKLRLAVPGEHNLRDAAAAVAAGLCLGIDPAAVVDGAAAFAGTKRRFQVVGRRGDITVIDDYAHHPTEIAATIATARALATTGRVIVCFQPHLFTRTRDFADDFGRALAAADEVVVTGIFAAREDPIPGVTGRLVADAAQAHGASVHYAEDLAEAGRLTAALARPGDIVVTVGAGSVTTIGPAILEEVRV